MKKNNNSGKFNRYSFCKRIYKDYLIILINKNKYCSCGVDYRILKYLNFKFSTKINLDATSLVFLDKLQINYIVLDNMNIIMEKHFENNNYERYYKRYQLSRILEYFYIEKEISDNYSDNSTDTIDNNNVIVCGIEDLLLG